MNDLFPNALHVARREYLFRVRGRAFRITTVLLAVAVMLVTLVPTILGALGVADPPEIGVHVDAGGRCLRRARSPSDKKWFPACRAECPGRCR